MDLENLSSLSPDELVTLAREKAEEAARLASEKEKLEKTKVDLIIETKRRKKAAQLIDALGIDLKEVDVTEKAAEILNALEKPSQQQSGLQPMNTNQDAQEGQSGPQEAQLNPEIAAAMKRMEQQINSLKEQYQQAESEKQQAIQRAQQEKLERIVMDKLTSAGCLRPQHVFKLTQDKYRFSEDGQNVVSGDEYDPVSLEMVIGNLRENDEYSIYFQGSGMTGSGMQGGSGNAPVTGDNPFHAASKNVTKASLLWQNNRERAKLLMSQARAAGKLAPEFAALKD